MLGLKFALGHTNHLTSQNAIKRCFLTKSSFALNKLNDLHLNGDVIERKMELLNGPISQDNLDEFHSQWLDNKRGSSLIRQSNIMQTARDNSRLSSTSKCERRINSDTNSKIIDSSVYFRKDLV